MSMRLGMLKTAGGYGWLWSLGLRRWVHGAAMPPPLDSSLYCPIVSPSSSVLPECDKIPDVNNNYLGFEFPSVSFGGSMELMTAPKKRVSRHKRGIRNGPKALKPTPVIIRCKSCGRVKLPHFYCCSGGRGKGGEQSN